MKKNKLIATSYYGTTIGLIIFLLSIFVFGGGIEFLLYMALFLLLLWAVVSILNKLLPEIWIMIIFFGVAITALHLYVYSWLFTLLLTGLAALYIFSVLKMGNKKWLPIVIMIGMSLLISFHDLFEGNEEPPEVTEQAIQSAISAMEDEAQVMEAFIGVDEDNRYAYEEEDIIFCALVVEDYLSLEEKKLLGNACAEMISDNVAKDNDQDVDLYDHYILEINIKSDDVEHVIHTRKGTETSDIIW